MGLKKKIKGLPLARNYFYARTLYSYYKNEHPDVSRNDFVYSKLPMIHIIGKRKDKRKQIVELINQVRINPSDNKQFFYSVDPYTRLVLQDQILDNFSIDYEWVVKGCLKDNDDINSYYSEIIDSLSRYVERIQHKPSLREYSKCFEEINTLFSSPAEHFHEAIQRVLFVNQWLWQSAHKHNGFGHLDWILNDLYEKDLSTGVITEEDARQYIKDFFLILHNNCWFKSTMLLGDTGQIVILGGVREDGKYYCNKLSHLFIEVSKELKLPDPKVLLRVSKTMPDDLLRAAVDCIATGIGAPFLSNDDRVIPAMIQYGYEASDAYNYATSACWEPLVIGNSCDQNNITTVNFCAPFIQLIESDEFDSLESMHEIKRKYLDYMERYLNEFLTRFDIKQFEEDPFLSLFSPKILSSGKDIVRGGAKYANLGMTSVGLSTVVNSLLNLEQLVFVQKKYSLKELNEKRKENFANDDELRETLDRGELIFGNDDEKVIQLLNDIMLHISRVFEQHTTKLGGRYKFGLSSPNYVVDGRGMPATFDGRRSGEPFGVHISGKNGLAPTELMSFASQLDYNGNRINGNVVDFIVSPMLFRDNFEKAFILIKSGIDVGFYQLQINVVDSKTLIMAKNNPELFPDLVVRVWGFSAYFNDLPAEYQDNLIKRAIEAETNT